MTKVIFKKKNKFFFFEKILNKHILTSLIVLKIAFMVPQGLCKNKK